MSSDEFKLLSSKIYDDTFDKKRFTMEWFIECVHIDDRLDVALTLRNAKWCQWCIDNDPELEFIDTPMKRENENYHKLNELLGY